jgi:hypothetical protein
VLLVKGVLNLHTHIHVAKPKRRCDKRTYYLRVGCLQRGAGPSTVPLVLPHAFPSLRSHPLPLPIVPSKQICRMRLLKHPAVATRCVLGPGAGAWVLGPGAGPGCWAWEPTFCPHRLFVGVLTERNRSRRDVHHLALLSPR